MQLPTPLEPESIVQDLAAFAGVPRSNPSRISIWSCNFGGDRPSYSLDQQHIVNLYSVAKADIPPTSVFDVGIIERWKIVNALIVQPHVSHGSLGLDIAAKEGPALATQVAFPLLERIAQNWTKAWNDDGALLFDIPEEAGLLSRAGNPKSRKSGETLYGFSDRMQILRWRLDAQCREVLDNFDTALAHPDISVGDCAQPLFRRLSNRRNAWAHGHAEVPPVIVPRAF